MAQLLVRNIPDALARTLKLRGAEHGISAEEEHRRILQAALAPERMGADKPNSLFGHIRRLGEIAPDFEIVRERRTWARSETEI